MFGIGVAAHEGAHHVGRGVVGSVDNGLAEVESEYGALLDGFVG